MSQLEQQDHDQWGEPLAAAKTESLHAWNLAWDQAMHFIDDPFETLSLANESDEAFALGSVFCAVYRVLGAGRLDDEAMSVDVERARRRASSEREVAHVAALEHLAAGNFTAAGDAFDEWALGRRDFAAVRFAHDIWLHVGDEKSRLRSSMAAVETWEQHHGWNLIAGQYAFALEESGLFEEAERAGYMALDADPQDVWARHALCHLYESLEDSDRGIDLLRTSEEIWTAQDGLAVHMWWHLCLRLIATGQLDEVLNIHDRLVPVATTPFRLGDLCSMLWRLELVGVDVGDRWGPLAESYANLDERHTCGFIDLHMAMAFTRSPDHPEAAIFFSPKFGVSTPQSGHQTPQNEQTMVEVAGPLALAIRDRDVAALRCLQPELHRIGGSNVQRDIVPLTITHWEKSL